MGPQWSPVGDKIVLNLKRVTAGPKFDGRPTYSQGGTKLAFESNRNGNYGIHVMNLR